MSIADYNGAAIVGMSGKDCVAIAADRRFGIQGQMVANDFDKIFRMTDTLYVGLAGLATDVQTMSNLLEFRLGLYELREERQMSPQVLAKMLSSIMYEKRFGPYFVAPVVAGLDAKGQPFLSTSDSIGALATDDDFVVAGNVTENLNGMCESLYRKDMGPEELFETISQCIMSATDRNAITGNGAVVHVITKEGVITRELKGRQD